MINSYMLENIKQLFELNNDDQAMPRIQEEVQTVVYSLGGTRNISKMSPGAAALYLTILLELNRGWYGITFQIGGLSKRD